MNNGKLLQRMFGLFLVVLYLAGCGGQPVEPTATLSPIPPTATPLPPTPTIEPTTTFSPEIVASKPEDIAGVWLVKNFIAPEVKYNADLTFRLDGTVSFDDRDDKMHIFDGTLGFADGQVTIDSDECWDPYKGVFSHCTMTFTIFSQSQSGKPVRLRFVSVGGKGVFIKNLDGKTLLLDEP